MNKKEMAILKLVNIGLNYDVDPIYILQDIEGIINMDKKNIKVEEIKLENYLD